MAKSTLPLVSVIVPVFNGEKFIRRAIASIQEQTYPQLEILVIDDGSTDRTQTIVEACRGPFPIRYFYQENKGQSAARNRAIAEAKGQFLSFLDADDTWRPEKTATQIALFLKEPALGLVFSNAARWDERGNALPDFFSITTPYKGHVTEALLSQNFIPTLTVMMQSSLLKNTQAFNEHLHSSEDYELWIRLSLEAPFAFLPEKFADYYVQESSASRSQQSLLESDIVVLLMFFQKHRTIPRAWATTIANHLHLHLIVYNLFDRPRSRQLFLEMWNQGLRHWKLLYVYCASFFPLPFMLILTRSQRIYNEMHHVQ